MSRRLLAPLLFACCCLSIGAHAAVCTVAEARAAKQDAVEWLTYLTGNQVDHYFHLGKWNQAVAMLDRQIEITPADIDPYSSAAWLLWSNGRNDEAMRYYHRMIAADPNNPEGYFIIGTYYYQFRRQYADALGWYRLALDHGLQSPKRHMYGHTLEHLNRTADALAFWRQIAAEDPKDAVAARQITRLISQPTAAPPPAPAGK